MKWLLKRLSEPSTAAGISAAAQAAYAAIYSGMPMSVALPAGMAGVMAVLLGGK